MLDLFHLLRVFARIKLARWRWAWLQHATLGDHLAIGALIAAGLELLLR
jgi:hypothetical protein